MNGPGVVAGESVTPRGDVLEYRDHRETSLPLLVLGAVVCVSAIVQLVWPGSQAVVDYGVEGSFADPATGMALALAFAVIWLTFRQRAARRGARYQSGFAIAALIGVVLSVPLVNVLVVLGGPFLVFGPGLLAAGIRLRNDFLAGWALVIGAAGIFEASVGISRLVVPAAGLAQWQHYATCLLLGVLTVLAGIVARTRETREVKMARLAGS